MNNKVHRTILKFAAAMLVIFLISVPGVNAQVSEGEFVDAVYLKDGSVIRGQIMELYPDSIVRIQILGGSEFVYEWDEVEKISKENKQETQGSESSGNSSEFRKKEPTIITSGFTAYLNGAFVIGEGTFFTSGVSSELSASYLYALNQMLQTGIGGGLIRHSNDISVAPVFAEIRGDLIKESKLTVYYMLRAGYSFPVGSNPQFVTLTRGGPYFGGGMGLKVFSSGKFNYLIGLQYLSHQVYREFESLSSGWWWPGGTPNGDLVRLNYAYQRFGLNMGVQF